MKNAVHVMVELSEPPAAVLHAEALKEARAQADAARSYALAHPNGPGAQELIHTKVRSRSALRRQIASKVTPSILIKCNKEWYLPLQEVRLTGGCCSGFSTLTTVLH
jgi:hypothetical protein